MQSIACTDLIGYCPFHIADSLRLWAGVDVAIIDKQHTSQRDCLIANGQVTLKTTALHTYLATNDPSSQIIAHLAEVSPGCSVERLVIGKNCPSLQYLQQAIISYIPGGLEHFYLYYAYKQLGIRWPDEQQRREVDNRSQMIDLFRRGKVDAVIMNSLRLQAFRDYNYHVVNEISFDAPIFSTVLVASRETITKQCNELIALLDGYFQAVDLVSNRDKYSEVWYILLRRFLGPRNRIDNELQAFLYSNAERSNAIITGKYSPTMCDRIEEIQAIWHEIGVIKDPICKENSVADIFMEDVIGERLNPDDQR